MATANSAASRNALWLWLAAAVLAADQATKLWASGQLELFRPVPLFPGVNLTLLHNSGAAFSFLADAGGWQRWFFIILTVVVCIVLVGWLLRLDRNERRVAAALALILGGALGNLVDRIAYGYVVDFLDLYVRTWHWPAFNLADAAITLGVVLLLADGLFGAREQG